LPLFTAAIVRRVAFSRATTMAIYRDIVEVIFKRRIGDVLEGIFNTLQNDPRGEPRG